MSDPDQLAGAAPNPETKKGHIMNPNEHLEDNSASVAPGPKTEIEVLDPFNLGCLKPRTLWMMREGVWDKLAASQSPAQKAAYKKQIDAIGEAIGLTKHDAFVVHRKKKVEEEAAQSKIDRRAHELQRWGG